MHTATLRNMPQYDVTAVMRQATYSIAPAQSRLRLAAAGRRTEPPLWTAELGWPAQHNNIIIIYVYSIISSQEKHIYHIINNARITNNSDAYSMKQNAQ